MILSVVFNPLFYPIPVWIAMIDKMPQPGLHSIVNPEPVEGPFMVRQAHHERPQSPLPTFDEKNPNNGRVFHF
jgi:hypothetical protein